MRQKTFGRKKRAFPREEISFRIDSSSPNKDHSSSERPILQEKSENAQLRAKSVEKGIFTPAPAKAEKVHPRSESFAQESTSTRKELAQKAPIKDSKTSPDDLLAAVKKLEINDGSHDPTFAQKAEIKVRPAKVTKDASEYLSPLLACKNVSNCVEDFQGWADERAAIDICKVGEGSFGEVYRATGIVPVILKLLPLNAKKGKGSRSYTSVASAMNEVTLLDKMQKIPGFVEFRGACVLQGRMASQFIKLWNRYLESGRTVDSKDPNTKAYTETQLWLLIEMSDAGRSLEPGQYCPPGPLTPTKGQPYITIQRTWDIWWQTTKALAKAEVLYGFEHRDLHGGNLCLTDLRPDEDVTKIEESRYSPKNPFGINKSGIQVTLIDYSLSRASFSDGRDIYYDFQKDKKLLEGSGDLQYDMYRHMAAIVGDHSCKEFHSRTNVVWLYFVLQLLLRVTVEPRPMFKKDKPVTTVGQKMLEILQTMKTKIEPSKLSKWEVNSAGDLLDVGIGDLWFTPKDIIGA